MLKQNHEWQKNISYKHASNIIVYVSNQFEYMLYKDV